MQDSHHQITPRTRKLHPFIWIILATAPFVLWGKLLILPTFDDWCTLSCPNYDPDWAQYFLPYGSSWRPFDASIGYLYTVIGNRWFPALSHLLIFIGHMANTFMVYRLCATLRFSRMAQATATLFFYMSPCVLATVFACDSLNQVYSQMWGLVAIYVYLTRQGRFRHALWLGCVFLATLSKENGLAWAVVPPIIAFGFERTDRRTCLRHLLYGLLLAVAYAAVRLSLPLTEIYYEEYHTIFSPRKMLRAVAILMSYTWLPGDYIYLLHRPHRNLLLFLATLLATLPFIWMLFFRRPGILVERRFLTLALCAVIAVSPNIIINLSMMNAYAWLAMAALIVALATHLCTDKRLLTLCFLLYLLSTAYTCVHHWYATWQTSLPGHTMAVQAVEKTGKRVDNVYLITIEDDERKYSSFYTLPGDAFGWGRAVWKETDFKWPTLICDTTIERSSSEQTIDSIARNALDKGFECVWIVNKQQVDVRLPETP